MGLAQSTMNADEFLAWELRQTDKHQFFEGEIFAMAGGTAEHNAVEGAVFSELRQHLKGSPCKVYIADMRVRAAANYFYPDIAVSCAPTDNSNPKAVEISQPSLIVEVLSDSTAAFDRGAKFASYRQISTLKEYLLLDPEANTVELFRKNATGIWELHPSDLSNPQLQLHSVDWAGDINVFFE
jgi:Uma2 family endonuclease